VALTAIQALKKENDLLKEQLVDLQNRLKDIETVVNKKNRRSFLYLNTAH
jgi:hypothetical protein